MKGKLDKTGDRLVLRFERVYPHRCEDVWRALVDPESVADWFPAKVEGERRAGAPLRFVFSADEGPTLTGAYSVFEPPRLLELSWADDVLRWELTPTNEGCSLLFTTTVSQRSNAPRDATGWDGCLDNLQAVLEGRRPPPVAREEFPERYREYVALLGMGEFPRFLLEPGSDQGSPLLPNPALRGQTFAAASGARLAVLHASRDGETREHQLAGDAYVFVIEGAMVLRLGAQELTLEAGTEFHIPGGGRVGGRVSAGTRLFYATEPA